MTYQEEALAAFRRGETDTVERLSLRELDRARASADVAAEVEALGMLARVAVRRDDIPEAQRLGRQALEIARGSGERRLERTPAHILAGSARMSGDIEAARTLYAESIALNEFLGESRMVVVEQHNLGYIELHGGNTARARELFAGALRRTLDGDYADMLAYAALDTAVVAALDADHVRATRILAATERLLAERQEIFDPDDAVEHSALRDRLIGALGQVAFDVEYRRGVGLDLRELLTG